MKILFISHSAVLSGGEIYLLQLISCLDRSKYEPIVLLYEDGPLVESLKEVHVRVEVHPHYPKLVSRRKETLSFPGLAAAQLFLPFIKSMVRTAQFIREIDADIVHTNTLKSNVIGGIAAFITRRPSIWHVHNCMTSDYVPSAMCRLFRVLCRNFSIHTITASKAVADSLNLPSRSKVTVVYSGVDETPFRVTPRANSHDGSVQATTSSAPCVMMVGRISPTKGQHIFIRAAAVIVKQIPSAQFYIVGSAMFGEDKYEAEIRKLVEDLDLVKHVCFSGFTTDVPMSLRQSTVVVHASTVGEAFGRTIVEAMMARKPVVASRGGGVPEIVNHGQTGLLYPMGDVNGLTEAILLLLSDSALASRLSEAGYNRAMEEFTIKASVNRIENIYEGFRRKSVSI